MKILYFEMKNGYEKGETGSMKNQKACKLGVFGAHTIWQNPMQYKCLTILVIVRSGHLHDNLIRTQV